MIILHLCDKNYYLHKMDRVRFHSMKAINKKVDVIWWGNGWDGYDNKLTVQENINNLESKPDLIIIYKPLEMKDLKSVKIPKCLRFNEMYDKALTIKEITESGADFVICHHENNMPYYKQFFKEKVKFFHIPHSAEQTLFRDYKLPKTIDLLLAGMLGGEYVLRSRIQKIFNKSKRLKKYRCIVYTHPGYDLKEAHTDKHIIDLAKTINSSKITLTCSMTYRNRLGKYVEIPMSASALAADLPDQDHEDFKEFMIVLDTKMKNKRIIDKLAYYLENDEERQKLIEKGLKWSERYTQEKYDERFLSIANNFLGNN